MSGEASMMAQRRSFLLGIIRCSIVFCAIFNSTYALAQNCAGSRFTFCKNCDTYISVSANKNVGCTLFIHRPDGYESMRLVGAPTHGRVAIVQSRPRSGARSYAAHIRYVPETGFSGSDSYILHVIFFSGTGRYETNARVSLNVR